MVMKPIQGEYKWSMDLADSLAPLLSVVGCPVFSPLTLVTVAVERGGLTLNTPEQAVRT